MSYLLAIATELIRIKDQKAELDASYELAVKQLKAKLLEVQHRCPHPKITVNPDPSGNGDSTETCDLCEYEL